MVLDREAVRHTGDVVADHPLPGRWPDPQLEVGRQVPRRFQVVAKETRQPPRLGLGSCRDARMAVQPFVEDRLEFPQFAVLASGKLDNG